MDQDDDCENSMTFNAMESSPKWVDVIKMMVIMTNHIDHQEEEENLSCSGVFPRVGGRDDAVGGAAWGGSSAAAPDHDDDDRDDDNDERNDDDGDDDDDAVGGADWGGSSAAAP